MTMKLQDAARHLRTLASQAEAHLALHEAAQTVVEAHRGLKDVEARKKGVEAVVAELVIERDELHENVRGAEADGRRAVAEIQAATKTRIVKLRRDAETAATELSAKAAETKKLFVKLEREHQARLAEIESQRAAAKKALDETLASMADLQTRLAG